MRKIGILHLSDVHINASSISEIDLLVGKLVNDIRKVKDENHITIDLICFAGDLIDRGDKAFDDEMQIQLAEEHFIEPLLEATELTKEEFIIVPGNHEVNKNKIATITEKGLALMSSIEEVNDTICNMEAEYKNRLKYFYDYMYEKYVPNAEKWMLGYSIKKI